VKLSSSALIVTRNGSARMIRRAAKLANDGATHSMPPTMSAPPNREGSSRHPRRATRGSRRTVSAEG